MFLTCRGKRSTIAAWGRPVWLACALFCMCVGLALAQPLQPIPELHERVTDVAGALAEGERSALAARLEAIEAESGSQVAVLVVGTTLPEPIEAYAIRVADAWKLGRKDVDDGVLILVAVDDRRMRIEVGRGLEGAIPDAIAKRIIAEQMTPAFKRGDFAGGITAAIDSIGRLIQGEELPPPSSSRGRAGGGSVDIEELFVVGMVASIFLGTMLKAMFGRLLGSTVSAGLVGGAAWLVTGTLLAAVIAGVLSLIFILSMGSSAGASGSRGRGGPWIGGGGGGGSMGGGSGGWSGGGGGFGGGGASGGW